MKYANLLLVHFARYAAKKAPTIAPEADQICAHDLAVGICPLNLSAQAGSHCVEPHVPKSIIAPRIAPFIVDFARPLLN